MGGGIIIKPVLDALHLFSVEEINFISSCTVLCMSLWSVGKGLLSKEGNIQLRTATFLAIGSMAGGVTGKALLHFATACLDVPDHIGAIQASIILIITLLTLLYTLKQAHAKFSLRGNIDIVFNILIGFILGNMGAFLGIGGGPFNVATLCYFFSMRTRQAAQNSLYIIMFSQAAGLLSMVFNHSIPAENSLMILPMSVCGVLGSEIGRRCNHRMSEREATILFEVAMILVMVICSYNLYEFTLQKG